MISVRAGNLMYLAGLLLAVLVFSQLAFAQSGDNEDNSKRRVTQATAIVIQKALEFVDEKKYSEARAELAQLDLSKLKPFGLSRVQLVYANIDNIQERYTSARGHLVKALESGGLNKEEASRTRLNVAQLYMVDENWAAAAKTLEEWFRHAKNPGSREYFLLAISYYRLDQHEKALAPAQKAVELMQTPDASRMRLLLSLYLERKDYEKAIALDKRMLAVWPKKKNYWLMLASLFQETKNPDMALAAIQVAYNAGYLSQDSENLRLADMLLYNQIPLRCARIIEANLANNTIKPSLEAYKKLGTCWVAAREYKKALQPLERAARLSDNGDLYLRLAQAQMQGNNWKAVVSAIQNAFKKDDIGDKTRAQYFMGIALFKQHKFDKARNWFEKAARDKTYRANANAYLSAIDACAAQVSADWCG